MKKERKYKPTSTGDIELSDEQHELVQKAIAQAEDDIAAARVSFRWTKEHVDFVKKVAGKMGIPYQTYIKQIISKQAAADFAELVFDPKPFDLREQSQLDIITVLEMLKVKLMQNATQVNTTDSRVTSILSAKSARRVRLPLGQSPTIRPRKYQAELGDLRRAFR